MVATTCRSKLGQEASRAEHQLRRLVGHANMLDMLIGELSDQERGLEGRVNALIRAAPEARQGKKVHWMDRIAEELEEVESNSELEDSSDDDSDSDEEDGPGFRSARPRMIDNPVPELWSGPVAGEDRLVEENETADQDAADGDLVLQRWPSRDLVPEPIHDGDLRLEGEGTHALPLQTFAEQCAISTDDILDCAALRPGEDLLATAVVVP